MEDKCLPVDVEFFKSISELNSVQAYNRTLQQFVTLLNNHLKTGLLSLRRRVIFSRRSFADRSPVFPPRTPDWKNAKKWREERGGRGGEEKKRREIPAHAMNLCVRVIFSVDVGLPWTTWLFADFSRFSTVSDVGSFPFDRLDTPDPSVKITLAFEVYHRRTAQF